MFATRQESDIRSASAILAVFSVLPVLRKHRCGIKEGPFGALLFALTHSVQAVNLYLPG